MHTTRRIVAGGLVSMAVLVGSACGSSTRESSESRAASTTLGTPSTTMGSPTVGGCDGTKATVKLAESGETATFDHAAGVSLSEGAAYTVYLSDTEIDENSISMVDTPEPSDGHHVTTVALTVFNPEGTPPPIEAGRTIAYTPDFGKLTFRVIDQTVDETYGEEMNPHGDITVTSVGKTLCFDIDYADDEKSVQGTVEAPVKQL
jgi:hypothetical protein